MTSDRGKRRTSHIEISSASGVLPVIGLKRKSPDRESGATPSASESYRPQATQLRSEQGMAGGKTVSQKDQRSLGNSGLRPDGEREASLWVRESPIQPCPQCGSMKLYKAGLRYNGSGQTVQRWLCRDCGFRFSQSDYTSSNKSQCLSTVDRQSLNRGSALLYRRQVCDLAEESKNLNPATETKVAGDEKEQLIAYAWRLKKRGLQDSTINLRVYVLSALARKGILLSNPDSFETVVATESLTKCQKFQAVNCYRSYTKTMNIPWEPIRASYEPKQPFLPTHEELSCLIHAAGKRTATFLQVALDTGGRVGEISKLRWTDVNTENSTISINAAEKGSRSRTIKVSQKTIAMIQATSKKYDPHIFNPNPMAIKASFRTLRDHLAFVQQNPRFKQIHLHSFRHFFATREYRKTKSMKHVQYLLGHKNIASTDIYTHLTDFEEDQYNSAVAQTVDEVRKLAEDGWEFYCEHNNVKIFRKPK